MDGLVTHTRLTPDKIEYEMKLNKAVQLRKEGWLPSEIADELGYESAAQVRGMINRRIAADVKMSAEDARNEDLIRLDALLRAKWTSAMDGDNRAAQTILRIMEMRMKLMGLEQIPEGEKKEVGGVTVVINKIDSNEMKPMKGVTIDVDAIERDAEKSDN